VLGATIKKSCVNSGANRHYRLCQILATSFPMKAFANCFFDSHDGLRHTEKDAAALGAIIALTLIKDVIAVATPIILDIGWIFVIAGTVDNVAMQDAN
jgi:hypothetical protein